MQPCEHIMPHEFNPARQPDCIKYNCTAQRYPSFLQCQICVRTVAPYHFFFRWRNL